MRRGQAAATGVTEGLSFILARAASPNHVGYAIEQNSEYAWFKFATTDLE
jgi:hypothetical protein